MTPKNERTFEHGSALALGVSLGLIFGLLLDNLAMGLVTGLMLATVANAWHEKRTGAPRANAALALSVGGLLLVALFWLLAALGLF